MKVVQCSGCHRPIGVSSSETPLRNAVFCDLACSQEPIVGDNELRDDALVELSRAGHSDQASGELFGLSRSRVQRIVSKRSPQVFF